MDISIDNEYITLVQLLKHINVISSGGEAKFFLLENDILVNEEIERRRNKKLYPGDVVSIDDKEYLLKWS